MLIFKVVKNKLDICQIGEYNTLDIQKLFDFICRFESIIEEVEFYNCDISICNYIMTYYPEWRMSGC